MRNPNLGPIPSELGALIDRLNDYEERLRILEAPSGESLSSTVAKLAALVANIQAQLDAWTLTRYTNAIIDSKDAVVNANIATTIASTLAGNVQVGGEFRAPNAYGFDITYTRRTAWWGNDGRAGYSSSSRKKKTSIRPADAAELVRLLDAEPKSFIYRPEIARRTRLRINDGIDYTPARELGLIAEELEELGLDFFVYHNEETGEPEGIEYSMLTVALLAIAREERAARIALEQRVERLEARS